MPTSFPPSPTAAIVFYVINLIFDAISAFYVGETLQQITAGHFEALSIKNYDCFEKAVFKDMPSITKTVFSILFKIFNFSVKYSSFSMS